MTRVREPYRVAVLPRRSFLDGGGPGPGRHPSAPHQEGRLGRNRPSRVSTGFSSTICSRPPDASGNPSAAQAGPVNRRLNVLRCSGFRPQIRKQISRSPCQRLGQAGGWANGPPLERCNSFPVSVSAWRRTGFDSCRVEIGVGGPKRPGRRPGRRAWPWAGQWRPFGANQQKPFDRTHECPSLLALSSQPAMGL